MHMLQRALAVLELDADRFREILAEIMRCARLQRAAILHHRFDAVAVNGARETFIGRFFARDHRQRQNFFDKLAINFVHAARFRHRIFLGFMRGMAFLPKKFRRAQQNARAHFPPHHIRPLVEQHRQVAIGFDPFRHRLADHRFRGRAHDQRFFQLRRRAPARRPSSSGDDA